MYNGDVQKEFEPYLIIFLELLETSFFIRLVWLTVFQVQAMRIGGTHALKVRRVRFRIHGK